MGHPSAEKFHHLVHKFHLPCEHNNTRTDTFLCSHCCVAKSHRLPFSLSNTSVHQPLALIHSDVWGPFHPSVSGFRYYVVFVDDFSRFTWLYPLYAKSEVYSKFLEFKVFVEKQFSTCLKVFRTDGGGEYIRTQFEEYLTSQGIKHELSCPYTPPQNGVAERKHRHLIETTITLLHQSSVPLDYWFDALATATYLINRLPSSTLGNVSPFEKLYCQAPDFGFMKVFGCRCYPWLRPYVDHKLQPRSIPCIFLGYHPSYKGHRCLDSSTGRIYISRHVLFDEFLFPFASPSVSSVPPPSLPQLHNFFWSTPPTVVTSSAVTSPTVSSTPPPVVPSPLSSPVVPVPVVSPSLLSSPVPISTPPVASSPVVHSMHTRSKSGIFKPKHPLCLSTTISSPVSLSISDSSSEPTSVSHALQSPLWYKAMLEEYNALQHQGTWSLVPLPPDKHPIGCKWVFKLKRNSDGSIARYKARLVAKGYLQEEGLDYHETFSPVAKQPTIRVLVSLALHNNWPIKQMDISNAFLHGTLHEEVYLVQPQGFVDATRPNHVCRLHKALYGLKQAPRAWFSTFSQFLLSKGFKSSHCDSSLFVLQTSTAITVLLIYVDDILLTGSDPSYIAQLVSQMHATFAMKELGTMSYFLGIAVHRTAQGYFLSQHKYALEILAKAGMMECKPYNSPLAVKNTVMSDDDLPFTNVSLYRGIVGALQ